MSVKIKLQRLGKIRNPQYRIVIADARTKRDGKFIEIIGRYHPKEDPSLVEVDSERAQYWLGVGAQPTEPVAVLLKLTGDWQKFKGLPPPERALLTKPARPDRRAQFEAVAKEGMAEPRSEATTPKKKAARKAAEEPRPTASASSSRPAAEPAAQPPTEPAET